MGSLSIRLRPAQLARFYAYTGFHCVTLPSIPNLTQAYWYALMRGFTGTLYYTCALGNHADCDYYRGHTRKRMRSLGLGRICPVTTYTLVYSPFVDYRRLDSSYTLTSGVTYRANGALRCPARICIALPVYRGRLCAASALLRGLGHTGLIPVYPICPANKLEQLDELAKALQMGTFQPPNIPQKGDEHTFAFSVTLWETCTLHNSRTIRTHA